MKAIIYPADLVSYSFCVFSRLSIDFFSSLTVFNQSTFFCYRSHKNGLHILYVLKCISLVCTFSNYNDNDNDNNKYMHVYIYLSFVIIEIMVIIITIYITLFTLVDLLKFIWTTIWLNFYSRLKQCKLKKLIETIIGALYYIRFFWFLFANACIETISKKYG